MRLQFKKFSSVPIIIIVGIFSFFLPYIFFNGTVLFKKGHFIMLIWMELLFLFTIFFLWYKIYYEIVFARVDSNILYYKRLFFIKKAINIKDIKGYKIGSEEADFYVLFDENDKKIFVIRMDFYSNYYDFIDELKIKELGIYNTVFQKIVHKIFR